jgi:hypothetical protein
VVGLPLHDAGAGLRAIVGELVELDDGLVDLARREPVAELPRPRLIGPYEPVLLGWRTREPLLGRHDSVVVVEGLFRAFALVRGRAAATWILADRRVELKTFAKLNAADAATLEADATDVLRFLDGAAS